ncbi:MAG TPA: YggT family protein, partial [Pyrinomonadaceae bacterium]|nr:YggT family protein [Pyrinomonadaceae bacterium]
MEVLRTIDWFIFSAVAAIILAAVVLILLRSLFKYIDKNPFTWSAITVKRMTDPVILPIRRLLVAMRVDPIIAPIIAIVLFILVGFFVVQITNGFLNTIAGFMFAGASGKPNASVAILGYVLYALIGLYELMIFARIVGTWFAASYANPWMRLLTRTTEPMLAPLRRLVPRAGMFDISPMVAFLILWLLQQVVASTLLRE